VLGALVFALSAARPGAEPVAGEARIVVTAGRIAHLSATFAATFQRPPIRSELDALVDDWVREEVYGREARRLGMDRDDAVVRRRLRQKMEFFVEDATAPPEPTDAELAAFLGAHADRFRREPTVTFEHVFFRPERSGDAEVVLARLGRDERDAAELGDPVLLPPALVASPRSEVARLFGEPFAERLATAPVGRWVGPVPSEYGLHLVHVRERVDGRVPALADVRDEVARELRAERRDAAVEAGWRRVRADYDVTVEWPP
jgi:hypothetical protein